MAEAARLLSTTGMDVAAVGRALGYADPFYFSRRFTHHHGQAPSRWRRQAAG